MPTPASARHRIPADLLAAAIDANVRAALAEDLHTGDITAQLIPAHQLAEAHIISREPGVLCGQAWVETVYRQLDAQFGTETGLIWHQQDGDTLIPDTPFVTLQGSARVLLTGERSALNFLQTLSGTASCAHQYAEALRAQAPPGAQITLLDTRKTLPGLRLAQKYAVAVGGLHNHRLGLWDAFLIKENHIAACGGVTEALKAARALAPDKPVQIEVETEAQLAEALAEQADIILLDNFSAADQARILATPIAPAQFELSGNIHLGRFAPPASPEPYRISIGALTKHLRAIDLSFRLHSSR